MQTLKRCELGSFLSDVKHGIKTLKRCLFCLGNIQSQDGS